MRMNTVGLAIFLLGFAGSSFASDFYVGGGVGLSALSGETEDDIIISRGFPTEVSLRGLSFDDRDSTWRLFAGYSSILVLQRKWVTRI